MITLERISKNNYRLTISDKTQVVELKMKWKDIAKLFCSVAGAVCQHINKEK